MANIHFLRPYWLFACIPLILFGYTLLKQKTVIAAWQPICDSHLLDHLLKKQGPSRHIGPIILLISSALMMILALAGPTWSKISLPTYQQIQPRVILLDLSENMLLRDLPPDRLTRAKFKLHDILQRSDMGQFGLIVYTGEPFVVSPLTDDGQTIDTLLSSIQPNIMPLGGNRLELALDEAQALIKDSGSTSGELLVLTAQIPSTPAVETAQLLARKEIYTSVMPLLSDKGAIPLFEPFAKAGQGMVIPIQNNNSDIEAWFKSSQTKRAYQANDMKDIPLWHDEGRWFLLVALLLLLPVFWRDWLLRINT